MDYGSFKDLESWKKAKVVRQEAYELCKSFPADEKYRLADQLMRSTRSVTANIAEGHGRYHFQENVQYCRMARGSVKESEDHFSVALECGFIDEATHRQFSERLLEIERILNGYIRFLLKRKETTK